MSYLLDFVKTFDEKELALFCQLDLIGKEELVRDAYAKLANRKSFDENLLRQKLGLSVAHFNKINSLLLSKSIHQILGNDYDKCFTSLLRRGLVNILIHQVKICERKVLKLNHRQDLKEFYKAAFEIFCSMLHPHFNAPKALAFGKKYLKSLGKNKTKVDETYVDLRVHQNEMVAEALAGNEETYRAIALKKTIAFEKKLLKSNNPTILFHLHFTKAHYVKFYGSEVKPFLEALETCKKLLPKLNQNIQNDFNFRVHSELAFGYVESNQFKVAEENFEAAFSFPFVNNIRHFYASGNYLNTCLINEHIKKAENIFNKQLQHYLHESVNRSLRFDVLFNGLLLQLYKKDFETAFEYLQQIKAYKRHEITLMAQLLIRIGETLYFYCIGDFKTAANVSKRNIRFMTRPENKNSQFDYHLNLMNCLYVFSKQRLSKKLITEDLLKLKHQLRGGLYTVFNQLL